MENLCDLLFELSNEDRLRILLQLDKKIMNVTQLSKELGLTTQESSRHLSRLGEVGLTIKDVDGYIHLTPYGELSLRQLQGQMFTAKHRDYFTYHTLACIPLELVSRIGELTNNTYIDDVMVTVHRVEETIIKAEEYILNINLPYIASSFPLIREAYERGVVGRWIHTKELTLPQIMIEERERVFNDDTINKIRTSGVLKEKLIDKIDLILYMSEKEVAILAFPQQTGSFDFLGFTSTDKQTHKWCRDLFQYYWERADQSMNPLSHARNKAHY